MKNRLGGLLGLFILCAGGAGLYVLFQQPRGSEEQAGEPVETVVPVETGQIRQMTLHDYLRAYGTVVPNPGVAGVAPAGVRINSPLDGIVTEVDCAVGQRVRKGQVLFALYDRPARLAVEQAEKTLRFAEENFERQDKLRQVQGTSAKLYLEAQQQLDDARNALSRAQAELELLKVTAPFDATVVEVFATPGEAVGQSGALARLTDMTRLVVRADIPTSQADRLQVGQAARIEAAASATSAEPQAEMLMAKVDYIDCRVDPNNDTVPVLIALAADTRLRPGRLVSVRITVAEYSDRLAVPDESIVTTPEGQTVLAIVQGDEAVPTPVRRGVREGNWVQIEGEGLTPGMSIVTVGAYGLPGKTKIRMIDR